MNGDISQGWSKPLNSGPSVRQLCHPAVGSDVFAHPDSSVELSFEVLAKTGAEMA